MLSIGGAGTDSYWATPAGGGGAPSITRCRRTTNLSCANSAWTLVGWDAEAFDDHAAHSTTANISRITVPEAYMHDVVTRAVDGLVQVVGAAPVSTSQVNRLRAERDERVGAFLSHPSEGD